MPIRFAAHNIRLDDGTYTKPDEGITIAIDPTFLAAKRVVDLVFPGPKDHLKLADLGCLEGGYSVEFARLGFDVLGLDVRQVNIDACRYVQSRVNLPNLQFVLDNALNIEKYGSFDVMFCCGLFYHLDKPREFLNLLSRATSRVLILDTHFSEARDAPSLIQPRRLRRFVAGILPLKHSATTTHKLSYMAEHEGLRGRWYSEFPSSRAFRDRENRRLASWDNRRSFWIQREYLLEAMQGAGFDLVFEQFDGLAPRIAHEMTEGRYRIHGRGTFIGIKTAPSKPDAG